MRDRRLLRRAAGSMVAAMSDAATRAAYERDGYLVERGVLSAAELDPVRGLLADQVGDYARKMHAEGTIDSLFEDEPFTRRFAAICAAMDSSPRGWIGNTLAKVYYDLFRHPGIARVLGAILGPEVSELGGLNVRTKIPEAEITAFPWHQDSHYYNEPARGRRVGRTEAAHIVTVWVPLVDATVANGCIWVMPGSHRWGLVDAARGEDMNVRTDEEIEQRGTPVALEMAAGDVLYLTNLTFHTSKMNRTEDSRWSVGLSLSRYGYGARRAAAGRHGGVREAPAVRRAGAAPGAQRIRRSFLGRMAGRDAATARAERTFRPDRTERTDRRPQQGMTRRHAPAGTLASGAHDTGTGVTLRPKSRSPRRLSAAQQAEFARQGYVIVPDVLFRNWLRSFEASYRNRLPSPRLQREERRNQTASRHRLRARWRAERILSLVEDLIFPVPGPVLDVSKGPREPHNVCRHQDEAYWHIHGASTRRIDLAAAAGHPPPQRLPARRTGQPPAAHHSPPAALLARPWRLPAAASCPASGSCATRCTARSPLDEQRRNRQGQRFQRSA